MRKKIVLPLGNEELKKSVPANAKALYVDVSESGVPRLVFEESEEGEVERFFRVVQSEEDLSKSKEHGEYIDSFIIEEGISFHVFEHFES